MAVPAGLRALRHRDFRLFWSGQLVSLIGTWMQSVGQSWLVLELTNSPFRLGLIGALQFGPILLFSFLGGAISDRVHKRRMLIGTQTALMIQAFTLSALVWSGHVQFWHVAVLVSRYGTAAAFLFNGLSFLAVIAALAAIRTEGAPRPRSGLGMGAEIAEGVRYALDEGAHGFGLLMASLGVGAVIGALAVATFSVGRPPLWAVVAPALTASVLLIALSFVHRFGLAVVVLMALGFAQITFMTACNTTVQITVPDELRGRIMGLYALVFAGMTPIGALIMGTVAERWGVLRACAVGGTMGLLLITTLTLAWRQAPGTGTPPATDGAPSVP